jgi:exodeoxyribonuclease VII large subunit
MRAPTPSSAAELVVRSKQDIEEQEESLGRRLARAIRYQLLMRRQALTEVAQQRAFARMQEAIGRRQQRLDDLRFRLVTAERRLLEQHRRQLEAVSAAVRHFDVRQRLSGMRRDLISHIAALASAGRTLLLQRRSLLDQLRGRLEGLSPVAILDRGYALLFDAGGKLVKDAEQVQQGDEITARLARGRIKATVKERESGT